MRVGLRAGFDVFSRYGRDAIDAACTLHEMGVDVHVMPSGIMAGLPRRFTKLLEKNPAGKRPDVIVHLAPPFDLTMQSRDYAKTKLVGWTRWDRAWLTDDFAPLEHPYWARHQTSFTEYDRLLVTSRMNLDGFATHMTADRMDVVPLGFNAKRWQDLSFERRVHTGVSFLYAGREWPADLLAAWCELKLTKPEFDAHLTIHTSASAEPIAQEKYNVTIFGAAVGHEAAMKMYTDADVFVAVGKDTNSKHPMEAMATGLPVIAADFGAHQNWAHPSATWRVGGYLAELDAQAVDFHVDKADLQDALFEAWRDPKKRQDRGRVSGSIIHASQSWEKVCQRLLRVLGQVV